MISRAIFSAGGDNDYLFKDILCRRPAGLQLALVLSDILMYNVNAARMRYKQPA